MVAWRSLLTCVAKRVTGFKLGPALMTQKDRRKSRLGDRKFQLSLLLRVVLQLTVLLAIGLGFLVAWEFLLSGPDASLVSCFGAVGERYAPAIVMLAALLPVMAYDILGLSNRMAGPVFRVRGALRRLAQGENVEPLKFRRNDYWQDLAADFNVLLVQIKAAERRANGKTPVDRDDREPTTRSTSLIDSMAS